MKKLIIEIIEETQFSSADKWNASSWEGRKQGFYANTDETGITELVYNPNVANYPPTLYYLSPEMLHSVEFNGEASEIDKEKEETKAPKSQQQGVSENMLLKVIAISQRPELVLNLTEGGTGDEVS